MTGTLIATLLSVPALLLGGVVELPAHVPATNLGAGGLINIDASVLDCNSIAVLGSASNLNCQAEITT